MESDLADQGRKLDDEAFTLLFDRYYPAIYGYLRRRVTADLAAEVAAETFLAAYRQRAKFDSARGDAKPWLFGIAANLMRRQRRREKRELRAYARSGVDPVGADLDGVEARLDAQVEARRLASELADLPAAHREVLLLYAWADLSYEEISDALDIPVGTVRSRLARCRRRLGDLLDAPATVAEVPTPGGTHV